MFTRNLTEDEIAIVRKIEVFVRDKHDKLQSHDYSHVLAVTQYAIEIGQRIPDPVDPFVVPWTPLALQQLAALPESSARTTFDQGGERPDDLRIPHRPVQWNPVVRRPMQSDTAA